MKNKYSDIIIPKNYLLNEDSVITEEKNEENTENANIYNLFSYDNKILQTYSFPDGTNTIYRDLGNDTLALLYQHHYDEESGEEYITIYEKNGVYFITKNDDHIDNAMYTTTKDYIRLMQTEFKTEEEADNFNFEKCIPIVMNSKYIAEDNTVSKKFQKTYIKYVMAENAIPTQGLLQDILSQAQKYIATKKINTQELLRNYIHLFSFQDFCTSSLQCVSPFVNDPSSVDSRKFIQDLSSKMNNIDKIIGLYLEEELKDDRDIDERGN